MAGNLPVGRDLRDSSSRIQHFVFHSKSEDRNSSLLNAVSMSVSEVGHQLRDE